MKDYKNKIKSLSCLALGSLMLIGCSDDFLKPDPLSLYDPETTFSTRAGLDAALGSADKQLRAYWTNTSAIDLQLPLTSEYMFSDMLVAGKTDDPNIFIDINERFTPQEGYYDDDRNRLTIFWGETYAGIKYANQLVSFIDKVPGLDADTKNEYLGRAYLHRSFRYLNLCFQFGDVPFVTRIIEKPKQNYRSTKKEAIIKKLVQDMEFAVKYVPDQKDMTYIGMINKGACRQLLIKCYLADGQFDKAKEQADILIEQSGYSLMKEPFGTFINPNPQTWNITRNIIWDLHRPENKAIAANKEAIMVIVNRYGSDSGIRVMSMRNLVPWWNSSGVITPDNKLAVDRYAITNSDGTPSVRYDATMDYNRAFGRGIGIVRPTWFAEHSAWYLNGVEDKEDLRHSHEVGNWVRMEDLKFNGRKSDGTPESEYYGQNIRYSHEGKILCNDTIRCWYSWPHYKIWTESPQDEVPTANNYRGGYGDYYMYRLAETYLLRAEAKYYLGDATAVDDVNEVRKRAGCKQLYTTVDIDDIVDERARELYLEEWRFTELSRISYSLALSGKTDKTGKTYNKDKLYEDSFWWQRITNYNNYYNKNPELQVKGRKYTMGKHNINWPIPQSAIDANLMGKLSQNYGYDGYDANTPKWETWEEAVADEDKVD